MRKERHRYVILLANQEISKKALEETLLNEVIYLYGVIGLSFMCLRVVYTKGRLAILKTSVKGLKMVRALICLRGTFKENLFLRIIRVTGTLKKAKSLVNSLASKGLT